jgi:hypothetical protein
VVPQKKLFPQNGPLVESQQLQSPPGSPALTPHTAAQSPHPGEATWANAGTRRLVSTGAVHAIAAPAPMRFNIERLETFSG